MSFLKILKNIITLPDKPDVLPRHIQLDITTKCNLNCRMCFSKKIILPEEHGKELSFGEFSALIDAVNPLSVNMIANGEPFMSREIFGMIKYLKSKNIQSLVSSNFIISRDIIDRIPESGLDILKVSIDGAKKETYEKIRGANYDKLLGNLDYLAEKMKNSGLKKPEIRFDFVIQGGNYEEIPEFMDFAQKYGVKSLYFHPLDIREFSSEDRLDILSRVDTGKLKEILKKADLKAKAIDITTNIGALLKKYDIIENLYSGTGINRIVRRPCILPWTHMFISVSGETSPCCAIYPGREVTYGNVFKRSINDVWNSQAFVNDRKKFKKLGNYAAYEACRYCMPMEFNVLLNAAKTLPSYIKRIIKK